MLYIVNIVVFLYFTSTDTVWNIVLASVPLSPPPNPPPPPPLPPPPPKKKIISDLDFLLKFTY